MSQLRFLVHGLSRVGLRSKVWVFSMFAVVVLFTTIGMLVVDDGAVQSLNDAWGSTQNSDKTVGESDAVVMDSEPRPVEDSKSPVNGFSGKGEVKDNYDDNDGNLHDNGGEDNTPIRAAFILQARNSDLKRIVDTVFTMEERFNKAHNYDWVFISDMSHSSSFQRTVSRLASGKVLFHKIDRATYLSFPSGINRAEVSRHRKLLRMKSSDSQAKNDNQRHFNKFWSREIFNMDFLQDYDYYMRINPDTFAYCDFTVDPFEYMKKMEKTYMFTFATSHSPGAFPTLWSSVMNYIEENPDDVDPDHLLDFVSDDKAESFNGCHFRSSLEVGNLKFFRGEKYQRLAKFLEERNGLYYEGWDESTIRTIGVTLLQSREKLQFMNNVGVIDKSLKNLNLNQCPKDIDIRLRSGCTCDPADDITWSKESCVSRYYEVNGVHLPKEAGD